MNVTAIGSRVDVPAAAGWGVSGTRAGHAVRSRVRIHVTTSARGRARWPRG